MYDHTFYKQVQIRRSDTRPHIKWDVSLVILHMITSIFLRALCGYIWVNILTLSPRGDRSHKMWAVSLVIAQGLCCLMTSSLSVIYDHIFFSKLANHQIRPHIKWAVSLVNEYGVTLIFVRGLCGCVWVNIFTTKGRWLWMAAWSILRGLVVWVYMDTHFITPKGTIVCHGRIRSHHTTMFAKNYISS